MSLDRNWTDLVDQAFDDKKFVCMGIDPAFDRRWPEADQALRNDIMRDLKLECLAKIRLTGRIVGFMKPNWAFFVQYGWRGLQVLEEVVASIHHQFPNVAVILDMKIGDIGETNKAYVRAAFDELDGDAITIHPYLGQKANAPFLDQKGKGIIVLCHTSNDGAGEFQHLPVGENDSLFLKVAENVSQNWDSHGNCALVTGATYPEAIGQVRQAAGDLPLLVPGIGKQGGDLAASVRAARRHDGSCTAIINASSSIFGAPDPEKAALNLHEDILAVPL